MIAFIYIFGEKIETFNKWLFKDLDDFINSRSNKWELNKDLIELLLKDHGSYLISDLQKEMYLIDTNFKKVAADFEAVTIFRKFYIQ